MWSCLEYTVSCKTREAMVAGYSPRSCGGGPPPSVPRRVCVPVQPAPLRVPGPPLQATPRTGGPSGPGHLPVPRCEPIPTKRTKPRLPAARRVVGHRRSRSSYPHTRGVTTTGSGYRTHMDTPVKNIYKIGDHPCTITAEVLVDLENDIDAVSRKMKLPRGDQILETLKDAMDTSSPFHLHRSLVDKQYFLTGLDVPEDMNPKLANALYSQLPLILYFDDFTDRVPQFIEFSRDGTERGYRLIRSRLAEWQRILEEVFNRATDGEHTIRSFMEMKDLNERDGLLEDINDVLNKEVVEVWENLKSVVSEVADDPSHLELVLGYEDKPPKSIRFQFRVADRSSERKRYFNVFDRSKGFQWFFNFQMKLKFNPKYQHTTDGAIYLLDEPGSYLHSSGQTQLLATLQEVSATNTILYCTHSQHLLDPEKINIGQTRIVTKEDSKIDVIPGSTPLERTLQRRPILGQEECHGKAKEVQRGV